jgi:hypothetical protein
VESGNHIERERLPATRDAKSMGYLRAGGALLFPSYCGGGDLKDRFEPKRERLRGGLTEAGERNPHDRDLWEFRPVGSRKKFQAKWLARKCSVVVGGEESSHGDICRHGEGHGVLGDADGRLPSGRTARGRVPLLRRRAGGSEVGGDNMVADVAGRGGRPWRRWEEAYNYGSYGVVKCARLVALRRICMHQVCAFSRTTGSQ